MLSKIFNFKVVRFKFLHSTRFCKVESTRKLVQVYLIKIILNLLYTWHIFLYSIIYHASIIKNVNLIIKEKKYQVIKIKCHTHKTCIKLSGGAFYGPWWGHGPPTQKHNNCFSIRKLLKYPLLLMKNTKWPPSPLLKNDHSFPQALLARTISNFNIPLQLFYCCCPFRFQSI